MEVITALYEAPFNINGPIRIEHRQEGYYVVGEGMCIGVSSYREGLQMVKNWNSRTTVPMGGAAR